MGLLDEAIREHLELKRRHGADDEEIARQEAEAFGPLPVEADEEEAFAGFDSGGEPAGAEQTPDGGSDRAAEAGLTGDRDLPDFEWHGSTSDDIDVPSFVLEDAEGEAEPGAVPSLDTEAPPAGEPPPDEHDAGVDEQPRAPFVADAPTEAFIPIDLEPPGEPLTPGPPLEEEERTALHEPLDEASVEGEREPAGGDVPGPEVDEAMAIPGGPEESYAEAPHEEAPEYAEPPGPEPLPRGPADAPPPPAEPAEEELSPPFDDPGPSPSAQDERTWSPPLDQPTAFMRIEDEPLYEPAADAETRGEPLDVPPDAPFDLPPGQPDPLVESAEERLLAPEPLSEQPLLGDEPPVGYGPPAAEDASPPSEPALEDEPPVASEPPPGEPAGAWHAGLSPEESTSLDPGARADESDRSAAEQPPPLPEEPPVLSGESASAAHSSGEEDDAPSDPRSARGFFENTQQHEGVHREQREGRDPDFEG